MAHGRERIQKKIHMKVADMLLREMHDPRLRLVTITQVELSKDRTECRVLWSTLEEGGKRSAISHALDDATGYFQREVGRILRTRVTPRMRFVFDPSVERAERITRLLREAREADERLRAASPGPGEDPGEAAGEAETPRKSGA